VTASCASAVPSHAGHLDLLPLVRRLFRHRIGDARLRTVETSLLGVRRIADVEGPEIPGRYLSFLRDGSADLLADVVRHNAQDVRSLATLLAHLAERYGDRRRWPEAPPGDLAGLARAFRREERLTDALDCLDAALDGAEAPDPFGRLARPVEAEARYRMAQAYVRLGKRDRAVDSLRVAVDRGGESEWVRKSNDYLKVLE